MPTAEFGDPAVVGGKAGRLVVEILVIAQQHANSGINDFGSNAVARLILHASVRIPAASMQLAEFDPRSGDLVRRLAGRGDQPQMNRLFHAVDLKHVAIAFGGNNARRLVAPGAINMRGVGVWCFGNVRVSRNNRVSHGESP